MGTKEALEAQTQQKKQRGLLILIDEEGSPTFEPVGDGLSPLEATGIGQILIENRLYNGIGRSFVSLRELVEHLEQLMIFVGEIREERSNPPAEEVKEVPETP